MSYYDKIEKLTYREFVDQLIYKYDIVRLPYYTKGYFRSKDSYATENGLYVHHVNRLNGLELWKKSVALKHSYELQQPANLVYCNPVERAFLYVLYYESCLTNGYMTLYGETPKLRWLSQDLLLDNTELTEEELEIVIKSYIREVAFAKALKLGIWGGDLSTVRVSKTQRYEYLTYVADIVKTKKYDSMYELIYENWKDKDTLSRLFGGIDVADYYFSQME